MINRKCYTIKNSNVTQYRFGAKSQCTSLDIYTHHKIRNVMCINPTPSPHLIRPFSPIRLLRRELTLRMKKCARPLPKGIWRPCQVSCRIRSSTVADLYSQLLDALPSRSNFFKFPHSFGQESCQIIGFLHQTQKLAPFSICLENPGSATTLNEHCVNIQCLSRGLTPKCPVDLPDFRTIDLKRNWSPHVPVCEVPVVPSLLVWGQYVTPAPMAVVPVAPAPLAAVLVESPLRQVGQSTALPLLR